MTSATKHLRELLDERGVEYRAIGDATFWETHDGAFRFKAKPHAEKLTVMTCCSQKCTVMTPEQAVAATLGRGECHKVRVRMPIEDEMHCSECGRFLGFAGDVGAPPCNFCPNCGTKVVDAEVDG